MGELLSPHAFKVLHLQVLISQLVTTTVKDYYLPFIGRGNKSEKNDMPKNKKQVSGGGGKLHSPLSQQLSTPLSNEGILCYPKPQP